MSNERKRLQLNRETVRQLNNDEMSYVNGGEKAMVTFWPTCGGKPIPHTNVLFKCAGGAQTMNADCAPLPKPRTVGPLTIPFPSVSWLAAKKA